VRAKFFRPCRERPWGLYSGYRVSFPRIKRPGRDVNHSPTSSAEVKERIALCLYSPYCVSMAGYRVNFTCMKYRIIHKYGTTLKPLYNFQSTQSNKRFLLILLLTSHDETRGWLRKSPHHHLLILMGYNMVVFLNMKNLSNFTLQRSSGIR
jgi:hypothetical protein